MFRAANELLRMTLDGVICLCLRPINYSKNTSFWEEHSETKELNEILKEVEVCAIKKRSLISTSFECGVSSETDDEDEDDEVGIKDDSSTESVENTYCLLPAE